MVTRRQFLRGKFSAPPTSAPDGPREALIRIGDCIAFAQNVVCRSCGDACGEAAIRFSPRIDGAACPVVLAERCTACGECVPACPASAISLALAGQPPK
ncbi:MAG: 4Fe-4S dicluster domain-containing protein [Pseudomonadota bacterium]